MESNNIPTLSATQFIAESMIKNSYVTSKRVHFRDVYGINYHQEKLKKEGVKIDQTMYYVANVTTLKKTEANGDEYFDLKFDFSLSPSNKPFSISNGVAFE